MSADEVSKRNKRNRRHGHESERMVVRYLRDNGFPDAETTRRRLGADGARQPGDISFTPGVSLEIKSRKASAWPSWQAQALAEAGPDRIAVVVRRTRGNPRVGEWECRWGEPCVMENFSPCDEGICIQRVCGSWQSGSFADFLAWLTVEEAA